MRRQCKRTSAEIADELTRQILKLGIAVHRYDAVTTKSVYLNLDYGVCNSVRISDHRGKAHLRYAFNVMMGGDQPFVMNDRGFERRFYPETCLRQLVNDIRRRRAVKINRYDGPDGYEREMRKRIAENAHQRGFWQYARRVEEEHEK